MRNNDLMKIIAEQQCQMVNLRGLTLKYNNQVQADYFTDTFPQTLNGITISKVNGKIVLNGTSTGDINFLFYRQNIIVSGHKYFTINLKSNGLRLYGVYEIDEPHLVTATSNNDYVTITIKPNKTLNNYVFEIVCIDLTELGLADITSVDEFYRTALGYQIKNGLVLPYSATNQIMSVKTPFTFIEKLPIEYQEVEYIEASGTQFIETNWAFDERFDELEFEFKYYFDMQDQSNRCVSGIRSFIGTGKMINHYNNYFESTPAIPNEKFVHNEDVYMKFKYEKSGNSYNIYLTYETSSFGKIDLNTNVVAIATSQTTLPLLCFREQNGANEWFFTGKIYYYKIKINGVYIRDFVPCYRKSDNVIGLYDLVEKKFYVNARAGTFTKGNNVGLQPLTYIRTKRVDLGTLNWIYQSVNRKFYALINGITQNKSLDKVPYLICGKYQTVGMKNLSDNIGNKKITLVFNENNLIQIADNDYDNATAFKNSLQGVILEYETAEPLELNGFDNDYDTFENTSGKVVRKIGKIKLNDATINYSGGVFNLQLTGIELWDNQNEPTANVMVADYQIVSINGSAVDDICIAQRAYNIKIKDSRYTSVSALKSAKGNVVIYYKLATPTTETERSVLIDHRYNKVVDANGIVVEMEKVK